MVAVAVVQLHSCISLCFISGGKISGIAAKRTPCGCASDKSLYYIFPETKQISKLIYHLPNLAAIEYFFPRRFWLPTKSYSEL